MTYRVFLESSHRPLPAARDFVLQISADLKLRALKSHPLLSVRAQFSFSYLQILNFSVQIFVLEALFDNCVSRFHTSAMPSAISSDLVRRIVDALQNTSESSRRIAERFQIGEATVRRYRQKLEAGDDLAPRASPGRPRSVLTVEKKAQLETLRQEDNTRSLRDYAKAAGVSHVNVFRHFREDGVATRRRPSTPLLTATQRTQRIERSKHLLARLKHGVDVIWYTDEKNFTQVPFVNANSRVRVKTSEELTASAIPTVKHPQSVMVFGLVGSDGKKMPLIFFERGFRLNALAYLDVLEQVAAWIRSEYPEMIDSDDKPMKEWRCTFQQDSAPAHTARTVQQWLVSFFGRNRIWRREEWPASSPDLNPLDFSVWNEVQRRACKSFHPTLDGLKADIKAAWENEITPEYIRRTCADVRRRLELVAGQRPGLEHFAGQPIRD